MREYAINDKICENMRDFEKYAKSHVPHLNSALGVTSLVPPRAFRDVLAARVVLFLIIVESIAWIAD